MLALAAGGTLVVAPRPVFPPALVEHRATASVITVSKLQQLVRAQRESPVDLSGLGGLMVPGSPLSPARLAEALEVLGPVLFHGYGQTGTGMIAMATDPGGVRMGSQAGGDARVAGRARLGGPAARGG